MRTYSSYANDPEIKKQLNIVSDKSSTSEQYKNAFYQLGGYLSNHIKKFLPEQNNLVMACSSEDADWLAKGIIDNFYYHDLFLSVFWNLQTNENLINKIAPIVKSYLETPETCDTLIICKSVIYTSCVVRTNLTYLIHKLHPKQILIVAPVIHYLSENTLINEFETEISRKFKFIYFAKDDEVNEKGELIPGIGGSVYERLGLSDKFQQKKYIPTIVKERRLLQVN